MPNKSFLIRLSYFEIYNDQVYDLLATTETLSETLPVIEDVAKRDFYVRGLTE
jgi:hypothetical protein